MPFHTKFMLSYCVLQKCLVLNKHVSIGNISGCSVTILHKRPIVASLKPCHTRAESLQHFHSIQKSFRSPRCTLCSRQQCCGNAVKVLCNRQECHSVAFILNMLKTNAAAWRLHSVLDSALWGRCGNAAESSWAPWERCGRAECMLYSCLENPLYGLSVCNAF